MKKELQVKVVIDTNIWLSFLIGQQLKGLSRLIESRRVELIVNSQLLTEIEMVSARPKFQKYFTSVAVADLMNFLRTVGKIFDVTEIPDLCRDPKDNFLLALVEISEAQYLVTGDKDLQVLSNYKQTQIVSPAEFEKKINSNAL